MRSTRWIAGLAATTATAGLLLAGTAFAGTSIAEESPNPRADSTYCTVRVPAVLDRIDRLVDRIGAGADTRGSTAWLEAKADKARAAGYTSTADLLDARVQARPARLEQLSTFKADVENIQATDCAT